MTSVEWHAGMDENGSMRMSTCVSDEYVYRFHSATWVPEGTRDMRTVDAYIVVEECRALLVRQQMTQECREVGEAEHVARSNKTLLVNENAAQQTLCLSGVGNPRISQAGHRMDERTYRW